jgi:hypothetical protein
LDYDIRNNKISRTYSMQMGNEKCAKCLIGISERKKFVVGYRCRCGGNKMDFKRSGA